MSQQALLKQIVGVLEAGGVAYMLTGSVASSLQGEPRSTHDIDLVVSIPKSAVAHLVGAFPPPNYYLDQDSIMAAVDGGGMFNLLEVQEGNKVDFWILTDTPFDQSRFARKEIWEVAGLRLQVSRPEDTILMKLRWTALSGGSEKHFTDALRVYEVQSGTLDERYMEQWAVTLGVDDLWQRLKEKAKCLASGT